MTDTLLEVSGLTVRVPAREGNITIASDVSFTIDYGETLGLVGESGSGKSLTARAILAILGRGIDSSGSVKLKGHELIGRPERELRKMRGKEIGMVFQEPMTALDPAYTVGEQIAETVRAHLRLSRRDAWKRAVEMLDRVHIPSAEKRARDYPHNFSGGMRQRVVIAMALSCDPSLLLADEPTTALDVTTQGQILRLLQEVQRDSNLGVLFVSHDLGVIADTADRVGVMYAGQIVEYADIYALFDNPRHPYSKALMECVPGRPGERMISIPGTVPEFSNMPPGCRFAPRCTRSTHECAMPPDLVSAFEADREFRCFNPIPINLEATST